VRTLTSVLAWLLFLTVPAGCVDDVAGHYVLRGVREVGSELLLKPDGTFEFMLAYGAADYWAKGAWRREGSAVILQSSGKPGEPFRLLRSEPGKAGRIRIWVLGLNERGVPNIKVRLKAGDQQLDATTDSDGAAVFPDLPDARAVAFEVRVYQIETGPFAIDPKLKDFYFEINGDAIQQVLFDNERLTIDGNSLLMTHWKEGPPMRYQRE